MRFRFWVVRRCLVLLEAKEFRRRSSRRGFSVKELAIASVVIVLLFALLLSVIQRTRAAARSVQCVANLRQIQQAFLAYAADGDGRFPNPALCGISWETSIRHYIGDRTVFCCPADEEVFPSLGSSYDWRDTGRISTSLAGKSIRGVKRTGVVLVFEALPGWHSKNLMNAAMLDGTAGTMDREACLADLQQPVDPSTP